MAEITFLAPGSCQLEVTAQGDVGTDTGVDLASVSWTIEQALIAGCRFSPSAGDVHIDRNGVLTIGRSLFDRINQTADDESIPGQCTLVIRADSTITDNVLDRFKVLVGYPGDGGGGGGGETYTITVYELNADTPVPSDSKVYLAEWSQDSMGWSASATEASEAAGGTVICADGDHTIPTVVSSLDMASAIVYPIDASGLNFTMPAHDVYVLVTRK